jgi:ABC-type Fe3+ transport system permease subunit
MVYEFASDDRHIEASPYALVLVMISCIAVRLLHFIQQRYLRHYYVKH